MQPLPLSRAMAVVLCTSFQVCVQVRLRCMLSKAATQLHRTQNGSARQLERSGRSPPRRDRGRGRGRVESHVLACSRCVAAIEKRSFRSERTIAAHFFANPRRFPSSLLYSVSPPRLERRQALAGGDPMPNAESDTPWAAVLRNLERELFPPPTPGIRCAGSVLGVAASL